MNSTNCEEKTLPKISNASSNVFQSRSREHGLSVFHCDLPPGAYVQADECFLAVQHCIEALNGWCEAGTRTIAVFLKVLRGTMYGTTATKLHNAMVQVQEFASLEMGKLLRNLKMNWCQLSRFSGGSSSPQMDSSLDNQIVAKELMNFFEGQCQFFINVARHLGQFVHCGYDGQASNWPASSPGFPARPVVGQNPIPLPVGSRPGVLGNKSKVTVGGTPVGLRKQVTSFLSKIGQKSPDTSCFYVPLNSEGGTSPSAVSGVQSSQTTSNSALGKSNGHVATQEDLDLVISMLSQRCKMPTTMVQAMPEHPGTRRLDGSGKAVGSLVSGQAFCGSNLSGQTSGAISMNTHEVGLQKQQQQQQEQKAIGTGFSKTPLPGVFSEQQLSNKEPLAKTNTWPFKPNQKPPWMEGDLRMMQNAFGLANLELLMNSESRTRPQQQQQLGTWPVREEQLGAVGPNNLPDYSGEGFWLPLTSYDMWPSQYSTWNTDCASTMSKSVNTVVETSSGSEESSNGDQQYGTGNKTQRRRRHSSGEHSLLSQYSTLSNQLASTGVPVDASSEDSLSWTNHLQMIDKLTSADDKGLPTGHRALSMQWSDPLNNRNLSCWNPEALLLNKALSSTPCSGDYSTLRQTTASGGQLDKSF